MQQENIQYVEIWSGWLRLAHWLIAACVLFLMASAWGIRNDYVHYDFWRDWHLIIGQLLLYAVIGRIILLFFAGSSNWRSLLDFPAKAAAMLEMLKFYLSFTRTPLPNWYAHNPLWKPLYLFIYLLLAGAILSGFLYDSNLVLISYTQRDLHAILATVITTLAVMHIIAVILHDWKGKGGFISAMINGHRYFHYDSKDTAAGGKDNKPTEIRIDIGSLDKHRDS